MPCFLSSILPGPLDIEGPTHFTLVSDQIKIYGRMTSDRWKCWGGDCVKRRRCNPLRLHFEPISDPRNAKRLAQAIYRRWVGVLQRMQEVYIIWRSLGTSWRSPRDRGRSPGDLREISGKSPGDLREISGRCVLVYFYGKYSF